MNNVKEKVIPVGGDTVATSNVNQENDNNQTRGRNCYDFFFRYLNFG